jgi:hypothetical protein
MVIFGDLMQYIVLTPLSGKRRLCAIFFAKQNILLFRGFLI